MSRTAVLSLDRVTIAPGSIWHRLPVIGGAIGAVGLVASIVLASGDPTRFAFSWLAAFLYFLSIALGGLFFVLVLFATKAGWGVTVRRTAENAMGTLPLFAALFLPVFLGLHDLFHWTHADAVAHDPLLQSKAPYLNVPFFVARAVVYFVVWSALATWFSRRSEAQDATGDHEITRSLQKWSGPAIILFALTTTFAAFDWLMSLDPHWYSTIFGIYFFAGCLVGNFAFVIVVILSLRRSGHLEGIVNEEHLHDMGKLLFAFSIFWAYIGFSQFFLIWYGNIPEETVWYVHRLEGGWKPVTILLAAGHFGVPFLFLMPRTIKRKAPLLLLGALWMLCIHFVDIYWLVMPITQKHGLDPSLLDATTFLAVGGFFLGAFGWVARRRALVPVRDPRLPESLWYENA